MPQYYPGDVVWATAETAWQAGQGEVIGESGMSIESEIAAIRPTVNDVRIEVNGQEVLSARIQATPEGSVTLTFPESGGVDATVENCVFLGAPTALRDSRVIEWTPNDYGHG